MNRTPSARRGEVVRLAHLRRVAGQRQAEVAAACGFHPTQLAHFEHGRRRVSEEKVAELRRVVIALLPAARARITERLAQLDAVAAQYTEEGT
jgi:transcriptional regulator with XRE-family HTH domain